MEKYCLGNFFQEKVRLVYVLGLRDQQESDWGQVRDRASSPLPVQDYSTLTLL
jgi:hypothetical protein